LSASLVDLVTEMSGRASTNVVSVSELLAGVVSLGDDTVAVFEMVPSVLGAVTLILMSGAVAPEASAAERVQVTVCGIEA